MKYRIAGQCLSILVASLLASQALATTTTTNNDTSLSGKDIINTNSTLEINSGSGDIVNGEKANQDLLRDGSKKYGTIDTGGDSAIDSAQISKDNSANLKDGSMLSGGDLLSGGTSAVSGSGNATDGSTINNTHQETNETLSTVGNSSLATDQSHINAIHNNTADVTVATDSKNTGVSNSTITEAQGDIMNDDNAILNGTGHLAGTNSQQEITTVGENYLQDSDNSHVQQGDHNIANSGSLNNAGRNIADIQSANEVAIDGGVAVGGQSNYLRDGASQFQFNDMQGGQLANDGSIVSGGHYADHGATQLNDGSSMTTRYETQTISWGSQSIAVNNTPETSLNAQISLSRQTSDQAQGSISNAQFRDIDSLNQIHVTAKAQNMQQGNIQGKITLDNITMSSNGDSSTGSSNFSRDGAASDIATAGQLGMSEQNRTQMINASFSNAVSVVNSNTTHAAGKGNTVYLNNVDK
jgi:hypothetical protein